MNISPNYTLLNDVAVAGASAAYYVGGASAISIELSFSANLNGMSIDILGSVDGTNYGVLENIVIAGGDTVSKILSYVNPTLTYAKVEVLDIGAGTAVTAVLKIAGN